MLIIEKSFVVLLWLSSILLSLSFFGAIWFWQDVQTHIVFASIATLLALFAHVSTIFYFVGTGIWIKDRAEEVLSKDKDKAFRIWEIYRKANWLKSYSMPFPTLAIFMGLFGFIFGGALQVGAIDKWIHVAVASLFVLFSWIGLILALIALKKNIEYLNLTSQELEKN